MTTKKFIVALVVVFLFVTGVGASTSYEVYIPLLVGGSMPGSTPTVPPDQCPQDGFYLSSKIGITVEDCVIVYITFWARACDVLVVYFTEPIPIVNGKFDVTGALYEGSLNINGEFTDKARGFYHLEKHSPYLCESSGSWSANWQDPGITPSPTLTPTVTPTPTLEPCEWNGEYVGSGISLTVEDCTITYMWAQCADVYFDSISITSEGLFTATNAGLTVYGGFGDNWVAGTYEGACTGDWFASLQP